MLFKNKKSISFFLKNPIVWLGIMAAVSYSSWPLGYLLNPSVAHGAFASQLEATNQPYNWLFVSLDVLSGVALLAVGITQWLRAKKLSVRLGVIGYMIFAILVIVAALIPFNCNSLASSCVDATHTPLFIIHGIASIVSVMSLLASVFFILKSLIDKRRWHWINMLPIFVILCWSFVGIMALRDYHNADENLVQYAFITICSLSLALAIVLIEQLSLLNRSEGEVKNSLVKIETLIL